MHDLCMQKEILLFKHRLKLNIIVIITLMQSNQTVGPQTPVLTPKKTTSSTQKQDYQILGTLGKGAYGRVSLTKKTDKLYAMKQIEKKKLARQGKQYQAFVQKQLLRKMNHPGIIKLVKCFQDSKHLNFVVDYCHGGDFTNFIRFNRKFFTQEMRIFYVAEIVSILEYLHGSGITHRDLKPENIMLSKDGHLKLIDFGTAEISRCKIVDQKFKQDIEKQKKTTLQSKRSVQVTEEQQVNQDEQEMSPRKRRSTFVGTCFYLSPQLLQLNICEPPSDLWALGCIIYQLYYLQPPFKAPNEYQIFEKIKNVEIEFPKNQSITDDAIDLMKKLLVKVPEDRLGANEKPGLMMSDLKAHPYFKSINFESLFSQKVPQLTEEQYNEAQHQVKLQRIKKQIQGDHQEIFVDKQQIVYSGMVDKKTFASYNPTYFILKKGFQLIKLTKHQSDSRRVILTPISEGIVAEKIGDGKFKLIADQCTLTVRTRDADKWIEIFNNQYKASLAK